MLGQTQARTDGPTDALAFLLGINSVKVPNKGPFMSTD